MKVNKRTRDGSKAKGKKGQKKGATDFEKRQKELSFCGHPKCSTHEISN